MEDVKYVLCVGGQVIPDDDPRLKNEERRDAEIVKIEWGGRITLKTERPLTKSKIVLIGSKIPCTGGKKIMELCYLFRYEASIGTDILSIKEENHYLWKGPPCGILHDHKVGDILIFCEI